MRKSVAFCVLLLSVFCLGPLFTEHAYAVPAAPIVHDLKQPDGTPFKAHQWGDEWCNGWETEDGYTIIRDKATGEWSFADLDDAGNLAPSKRLAGHHINGKGEKKHLRPRSEAIMRNNNL